MSMIHLIFIGIILVAGTVVPLSLLTNAQSHHEEILPIIKDKKYEAYPVVEGLGFPTSFKFIGPGDMLVLEKNTGEVLRVVNGSIVATLLQVNVSNYGERGLLGLEIFKRPESNLYDVFLYFSEKNRTLEDVAYHNRLYKYQFNQKENTLTNEALLLSIPGTSSINHNGGAILIGPDEYLYVPVGDMGYNSTISQNINSSIPPNGSGGILRLALNGEPAGAFTGSTSTGTNYSSINRTEMIRYYYAYGIRNSFGIDFDPVTGMLWDTENGPTFGDEINLVEPGFNSGWSKVQGLWEADGWFKGENITAKTQSNLVALGSENNYADPALTWLRPIGITALKFIDSYRYNLTYANDLLVGDIINGRLYRFGLAADRTTLNLNNDLKDGIVNEHMETKDAVFGEGFGGITDIEIGPDGFIYVASIGDDYYSSFANVSSPHYHNGKIFKIIPSPFSTSVPAMIGSLLKIVEQQSSSARAVDFHEFETGANSSTIYDLPFSNLRVWDNTTVWSENRGDNISYIELVFRIPRGEDIINGHAGVVWKDDRNIEYHLFPRSNSIDLVNSAEGILDQSLIVSHAGEWNTIVILHHQKNLYIFYNNLLKIVYPIDGNDEWSIDHIGVRSFDVQAEFRPIRINY